MQCTLAKFWWWSVGSKNNRKKISCTMIHTYTHIHTHTHTYTHIHTHTHTSSTYLACALPITATPYFQVSIIVFTSVK